MTSDDEFEESQTDPDRTTTTPMVTTPIKKKKASPPMTDYGFRESPRGVHEMGSVGVEVTRERRATMSESELQKLHSKATTAMKTKFLVMGETSLTEIYDLQARMSSLQTHFQCYSMVNVFIIRTRFDTHGNIEGDGDPQDLFKHYRDLSTDQVRRSNKFYHEYGTDVHHQDLLWSRQMLANSDWQSWRSNPS
jgi:hypothetical protein